MACLQVASHEYVGSKVPMIRFKLCPRRGTQVVRERSAKPLFAGSIPARASSFFNHLQARSGREQLSL